MEIRKLGAMALSAVLATAVLVPAPALALNSAGADYGEGEEPASGANVTDLTLVLQDPDANFASNGGSTWVAEHAKVQVPVAINFVVKSDGTIVGPSEGAAITNYSRYGVNVSNIKVTPASGVTFASTKSGATAADQVYLEFKPSGNDTLAVNLSDFTGANGAAPTAGEWNIGAAATSEGTTLNLTAFDGKIGGFSAINPLSKAEFGTIAWTIKAGTPTLMPRSLAAADVATLQAAGDAIRGNNATVKEHYDTLVGQTLNVTLGDSTSAQVRLVDVSTEKGLVFMFTSPIGTSKMRSSQGYVSWNDSLVRSTLNSGSLYTSKLQGMTIGGAAVTPERVTNTYFYNGEVTTIMSTDTNGNGPADDGDMYWVPSLYEVYGVWGESTTIYTGITERNEDCTWFAYFKNEGVSGYNNANNPVLTAISTSDYWLRTSNVDGPQRYSYVVRVGGMYNCTGQKGVHLNHEDAGIVPCFAL